MRETRTNPLPSVLTLAILVLMIAPLTAHASSGLPATITVEPEGAGPGSQVEIAGLDFPAGKSVDLQLTTTDGTVYLGTAATEQGGYFRTLVTLPHGLAPGPWELRATAPDGSVAVHILESGLAAPVEAAEIEPADEPEAPATTGGGRSLMDNLVLVIIAVLIASIGGALFYARYLTRGETRQPGMGAGDDPIWSRLESDS